MGGGGVIGGGKACVPGGWGAHKTFPWKLRYGGGRDRDRGRGRGGKARARVVGGGGGFFQISFE